MCVCERERERKTSWDQSFGINSAKQVECFAINRRNEIHSDVLKSLEKNLKGTERETISFFILHLLSPFLFLFLCPNLYQRTFFLAKSLSEGVRTGQAQDFHGKKSFFLLDAFVIRNFSIECEMGSSTIKLEKNFSNGFQID